MPPWVIRWKCQLMPTTEFARITIRYSPPSSWNQRSINAMHKTKQTIQTNMSIESWVSLKSLEKKPKRLNSTTVVLYVHLSRSISLYDASWFGGARGGWPSRTGEECRGGAGPSFAKGSIFNRWTNFQFVVNCRCETQTNVLYPNKGAT